MSWFRMAFATAASAVIVVGCASSQQKQRREQRDKVMQSSKLYCEFLNGEQYPDLDVALNLSMAQRCDSEKSFSLTSYKTPSEIPGIMYCCGIHSKDDKKKYEPAPVNHLDDAGIDDGLDKPEPAHKKVAEKPKLEAPKPKPSPTPAPTPVPMPTAVPVTAPEAKAAPEVQKQAAPVAAPAAAPAASKPAASATTETKTEAKSDAKSEVKTETKTETRAPQSTKPSTRVRDAELDD